VVDGDFEEGGKKQYTVLGAVCALGRLVATCRYMEHEETQKRMKASISAMDAVL
jgi:hypothetical protein